MTNEWDKFPAATPLDEALHSERVDPKVADIARSIYQQESGSGKNTKTSNAGAVGGMQVIPATFKRVADKDWDINNPVHNARAGVRYINKLHERAGGDPALTAVGYYGGEGAQDKAKRGVAVSDPRNPKAPNTLQYAQQVVGRLPVSKTESKPVERDDDWSKFPEVKVDEKPASKGKSEPAEKGGKKDRSMLEEVVRQVGLTARSGVAGLVSLPAMASDAVTGVLNTGADLIVGEGKGPRFIPAGTAVQRTMNAIGLPQPENAQERVVQDVASAMTGAGSMVKGAEMVGKAAGPVTSAVGKTLAQGPGLQVASAAAGSGASGATRESGGGTGAQVAAGLVGALTVGAGGSAKEGVIRRALRGGEEGRKRVADNLKSFNEAGTTPTLGQATESRTLRGIESALAKMPGGAGVIAKRAQEQADEMATAVQKLSDELAPGASAANAGEAISRGVNAFKQGFKGVQTKLYNDLDQHIPKATPIAVTKTQQALADLNADIPGAPNLSQWFKSAKIQGIDKALQADLDAAAKAAADGQVSALPYEAIKKLRTLVGNEIADNNLVSDVPRSKWAALYAALSDDLGVAAKGAGPKAEESWRWANTYTRTQLERLDQLSGIVKKDSPERIFSAAISGTSEGDTIVKRVINALPKQERREVAAAVLQRLGRATPGQQNAMGDAFSSETFLSNLSKLSPAARKTLFGRTDRAGIEQQVGNFAKLAESRRDGARVFANPSGTAASEAQLATAGGIGAGMVGTVMTGNPGFVAAPLMALGAARAGAKFMTNPKNAARLAAPTPLAPGAAGSIAGAAARTGQVTPEPADTDWSQFPEVDTSAIPGGEAALQSGMEPAMPGAAEQGMPQQQIDPGAAPATEDEVQQQFQETGRDAGEFSTPQEALDNAPGLGAQQGAAPTDPMANMQPPVQPVEPDPMARIERLRAAGETNVADVLQRRFERRAADQAAGAELQQLAAGAPDDDFHADPTFQTSYRALRGTGVMPAEAAGRAALQSSIQRFAPSLGMPEKATAALQGRLSEMDPEQAPAFVQRFVMALASRGVMPQPEIDVGGELDAIWERATVAAAESLYQDAPPPPQPEDPIMAALDESGAGLAAEAPAMGPEQPPAIIVTGLESETPQAVDVAAHAAATSPANDLREPTERQQEAGNYRKGKVRVAGMKFSIENPAGSMRRGVDPDGVSWETPMRQAHYGYLRGSRGADNEQIDVFLKVGTPADYNGQAFVIDQIDPSTGEFDEHKTIIGVDSEDEARELYLAQYAPDWQGLGAITALPMQAFRSWATGGARKQPLGKIEAPANDAHAMESAPDQASQFAVEQRPDGTIAVLGDQTAIRQMLEAAGVKSMLPMRGGVLVGRSAVGSAMSALGA